MKQASAVKKKKVLKNLLSSRPVLALNILTVIPLRPAALPEKNALRAAVSFFPLIGWLLGTLGLALAIALDRFLPEQISNVFLVTYFVLFTGALHLDGLADTVDGLFGGRKPSERLAIMRKSDIGAFGSVAVALLLIFKLTFLQALTGYLRYSAILAAPILSRWTVVLLCFLFTPARRRGFGKLIIGQVNRAQLALASVFLLPLGLILVWLNPKTLVIFILPFISLLLAFYLQRRFTGLTGDHLGFSIEIQEVLCLLLLGVVL